MSKPQHGLGRSGLWLGFAKLWFLVASYAISISLTHLLEAEVYGQYYVIARVIAVPNMVLIYTLLFSVSRPLAAQFEQGLPAYFDLRRRGVRMAVGLGGATALVFFLAAPALAGALADDALAAPIRVVAPISLVYALYAVNLGTLNAVRRFQRQATLDIFMASAKAGLIIAAAAAGLSLGYVVGGFTTAALLALGLSTLFVAGAGPKRDPGAAHASAPPMATFAGILIVFTAVVNLLQSADVLLLKSFARTAAQQSDVGFYSSAQQVALVPYSLMNAVALLVFPLVASLDQKREPARVRAYLTETVKICVLLLAFMSAVGSAASDEIQALLFPRAYGSAGDELRLLVWGFSGYSLAVTTAWIFNSAKRSGVAVALVVMPLVAIVAGSFVLVPQMWTSGAAISVAFAGGLAAVAALVLLWRSFGAVVPLPHLLKVAAAVAAVELLARVWPVMATGGLTGKLMILAKLSALSIAFIVVVGVTRAVTVAEIKELRHAR